MLRALIRELNTDPPAMEAMRTVAQAFSDIDPAPGYLHRVAAVVLADPRLTASMNVYLAGLKAARERIAARRTW